MDEAGGDDAVRERGEEEVIRGMETSADDADVTDEIQMRILPVFICAICGKDRRAYKPCRGVNTIRFTSSRGLPKFSSSPRSIPVAFR